MNKNIFIITALSALLALPCIAQEDDIDFSADRPGMTTNPDVMPKNKLMWEAGLEFENDRIDGDAVNTFNYHNSLFRYGLTDYAELRFAFAASHTYIKGGDNYGGISDLSLGTKVKIYDGYRALPKVAMLAELYLPGGDDHNYLPQHVGTNLHLAFSNEITSWLSLGYDVGMVWSGYSDEDHATTFGSINLNFVPADKACIFIEEYNFWNHDINQNMIEFGGTYMVSRRVQLDAYADMDLRHFGNYINVGLGVSWRIL